MTRALITGITGQDGSYLAELLLEKGYEVHGLIRRSSSFNTGRIDHIYQDPHAPDRRLILHYGDLNDASSLNRTLRLVDAEEIYNLGAQSHVKVCFDMPEYTGDVTGLGPCACSKRSASSASGLGSTRPPRPRCTADRGRCRRTSARPSRRAALTPPRRSTHIG